MNNIPSAPPLEPESFQTPLYYYGYTAPPTYPPPAYYPAATAPPYLPPPPPQPQFQKRNDSDSCFGLVAGLLCCCCLLEEVDNCTKY